mgnify:CR=1 FL=1
MMGTNGALWTRGEAGRRSTQMLIITATAEYKKSVKALLPEITPSFYDIQIINLSQIRDYTRGHKIEY